MIELMSAALLFFYENSEDRKVYVKILTALLAFDAFVLHCPFTERWSSMGSELSHFSTNIGLAGGLIMLQGMRDEL